VDAVLFVLTPQYVTEVIATAQVIIDFAAKHPELLVVTAFIGSTTVQPGLDLLTRHRLIAADNVTSAVQVLSKLVAYGHYRAAQKTRLIAAKYQQLAQFGQGKHHRAIIEFTKKTPAVLPEDLASQLITEIDLDVPKQIIITSLDEALAFCQSLYPVVIKAPNAVIAHKTDFQAVYVGIQNAQQLRASYTKLATTIRKHAPPSFRRQPPILIQEMITSQLELLVGANRDGASDVYADNNSGFGHLLVFGQGGIYTEVFKDLAYNLVPTSRPEITNALQTTKVSQILAGVRGQKPLAQHAVISAIEKLQQLLIFYPEIISVDINPLLVTTTRAVAVDVKIFVGH
jgi:acetyltransferase